MTMFHGALNTTINGGNFTAVPSIGGNLNLSASNDIVALLLSHSATAGLLDARERFDAPKCDEGTRISMIRGMMKFVQDGGAGSSPALYWLHGPAGVGKSALAQSLSLLLKSEGDHAASFFFSRTSPGRDNGTQLIVTLAYQLVVGFPALQPFMSTIIRKNPAVLTASNAVQMQSLIIDPINQWQKKYAGGFRRWAYKIFRLNKKLHPRLILVDGLDECSDPDVQRDLILCFGEAIRQLSLPFRIVIASRPESHILATFELDPIFQDRGGRKVTMKNLGDDEDADEQITTFLLKEFAEIRRTHPIREFLPEPWPLPGQLGQLVSKSSKGFIYPATVVRYIKMPNNRPDECLERILGLSEIPIEDKPYEPLDILYRYIFESIPDANKEAIRNIFHFLVVPNNLDDFITPRLIEKYYDYKPGHIQHVLRDLLCIVAFTPNRRIKVLHASLPDFLLDRSRSGPLCIDIGDAHAAIGAIFPLALNNTSVSRLPDFGFIEFLEHMMQASMSNTLVHRKLVDVDFKSRYMTFSDMRLGASVDQNADADISNDRLIYHLQGVAFVVAYLLVLVIKDIQQNDIRRHITGIKHYILQNYPFAASLHSMHNKLLPAMIPLLCEWSSSTINHEHINYIFACEVPSSQFETREEILELYLFMMAPFFGEGECSQNHLENISCTLLKFLLYDSGHSLSGTALKTLAANLLGVSLAHTDYSASLAALFDDLLISKQSPMGVWAQQLAPSITDYLKRVYPEDRAGFQELLERNDAWSQYLSQCHADLTIHHDQDDCHLDHRQKPHSTTWPPFAEDEAWARFFLNRQLSRLSSESSDSTTWHSIDSSFSVYSVATDYKPLEP